jgi:iron complex outermembrane receptor protein
MQSIKLFGIVILSCIHSFTYSQQHISADNNPAPTHIIAGTITGTITDAKTGEALPGASIYLHDLKKGTASDDHGKYRIPNLYSGKYLIEMSTRVMPRSLKQLW